MWNQKQQQQIENQREKAEVYRGDSLCKEKSKELLQSIELPRGLLPLEDIEEVGHNLDTGFVWVKQKRAKEHKFKKIGRLVWYDTEITAFVENRRMRRLTGVKSKELLFWVTVNDIRIADPESKKITFGTPTGISRSFPVEAFEIEEPQPEEEKKTEAHVAPPVEAVEAEEAVTPVEAVEAEEEEEKKKEERGEGLDIIDRSIDHHHHQE